MTFLKLVKNGQAYNNFHKSLLPCRFKTFVKTVQLSSSDRCSNSTPRTKDPPLWLFVVLKNLENQTKGIRIQNYNGDPNSKNNQIQWDLNTKLVQYSNGLKQVECQMVQCPLNTQQPDHLNTGQMNAILFSFI